MLTGTITLVVQVQAIAEDELNVLGTQIEKAVNAIKDCSNCEQIDQDITDDSPESEDESD